MRLAPLPPTNLLLSFAKLPARNDAQPRLGRADTRGMQLALRPLYTVPIGDHCAVVLRLPCGRSVDLIIYDGSGVTTTVCVWRVAGCAVHFVVARDA
jgi:hypothetical protein